MSEWTGAEIGILRRNYPIAQPKELKELLPNRSYDSIRKEGQRLGLKRPPRIGPAKNTCHPLIKKAWDTVAQNYTLASMSRESGISRETIRGWAQNRIEPGIISFDKLIRALGYKLEITEIDRV